MVMKYSPDTMVPIIRAHRPVLNEIEARDTVFRLKFSAEQRRKMSPWAMYGREELQQEEFELWQSLHKGGLSDEEAIEKMTDLMEQYYGQRYPLR